MLALNSVHLGDARELIPQIPAETVACSIWSPPYYVGKFYEQDLSYDEWCALLRDVIAAHVAVLKPGGFLAINIADILCFADSEMPRIQAANPRRHRSTVTREDVLAAKVEFPHYNRHQLAKVLGCSEQTVDRRLNGNNIRGGNTRLKRGSSWPAKCWNKQRSTLVCTCTIDAYGLRTRLGKTLNGTPYRTVR